MRKSSYENTEMTKAELIHSNNFLLQFIKLANQRKLMPIYRGDKLMNLFRRLEEIYKDENPNYNEVLKKLFVIGEKAKHFHELEFNGRTMNSFEIGEEMFMYIFDHLHKSIKSKVPNHIKFFEKNNSFKEYFESKANKKAFVETAMQCTEQQMRFFKERYLTLLHHLASINYKNKSHLISTSSSYLVADKFSNRPIAGKNMILHAWMPATSLSSNLRKCDLPNYKGTPYGWQKEISILAGILPHYIIALEIPGEQIFYNPHLFKTKITNNTFIEGFDIDQGSFSEIIKQTNYNKSFNVLGDKMWESNH